MKKIISTSVAIICLAYLVAVAVIPRMMWHGPAGLTVLAAVIGINAFLCRMGIKEAEEYDG